MIPPPDSALSAPLPPAPAVPPRPWPGSAARPLGFLVICLAALAVYWPALTGPWLWDDDVDIPNNELLRNAAGLWRIWVSPTTLDYYPLKFTVQWVQWQLWGDAVLGYHLVNVALHAAGALLLWRVFARLGLRFAWLGALVFVVHPLNVESVAWMAELKNTLSLPPLLLALLAWFEFSDHGRRRDYRRALAWFLVALLCKTSVVMFPVALLLHAWWRRGTLARRDLTATAPFFALSLALGLVTLWFQAHRGMAGETVELGGPLARLALAGSSLAFYAGKALWPLDLFPIYPRWPIDPPAVWHALPWLGLGALAAFAGWRRRGLGRHLAFGVGWFVLHLAPVVGFVPISFMRFTWVMDHFAYVALPGLIGLALAALQVRPLRAGVVVAAGGLVCLGLAAAARPYAATYASPRAFWTHALRGHPDAAVAHNNLGLAHYERGDLAGAIAAFENALRLDPGYFEARMNLGNMLARSGRADAGLALLAQAVAQRPRLAAAHYNHGVALKNAGRLPEALAAHTRAIELKPRFVDALDARGEVHRLAGRLEDARRDFLAALAVEPEHPEANQHLGIVLSTGGRIAEAIPFFESALRARPAYAEAHSNFAAALVAAGVTDRAIDHFVRALELRPDFFDARFNLGVVLTRVGRPAEAIPHLSQLLRSQPDNLRIHFNLANAYVGASRPADAVPHYEHALRLDASFAEIHVRLATALAALGRIEDARARYAQARRLDPSLPAGKY